MARQCMRCYISGTVQGVCFRAATKKKAEELEVTGWVRNLVDGRVEVFACGEEKQLKFLYMWLQKGPQLATVKECSSEPSSWQEFNGFDIV